MTRNNWLHPETVDAFYQIFGEFTEGTAGTPSSQH